ncbi:MAG: glycoside hydrolase [Proteobacteria bacterium]|nr:glycoside hydrolase [Pseudomonadota bacterium]
MVRIQLVQIFLLLLVFSALISCTKNNQNKTLLPLSKDVPILVDENKSNAWDLNLLEFNNIKYVLYTVIHEEQGYANIAYSEILNTKPLKFSNMKPLLPKSKLKKRYISSIVTINNISWIYYVEGDLLKDIAKSYRARFNHGTLSHIEKISIESSPRVIHWQKFHSLPNNQVLMVLRDGKGMYFAKSSDGRIFSNLTKVYKRGAKPSIIALDNQNLIYAFQGRGEKRGTMQSKFSYSTNGGKTWSKAINTTQSHGNVHDASLFLRQDGKADIYYIYPIDDWRGFSLFRRCIKEDYTLGDEEQVIEKEMGSVLMPNIFRLNNQQLLLTFIESNSNHTSYAAIIYGDSLCQ